MPNGWEYIRLDGVAGEWQRHYRDGAVASVHLEGHRWDGVLIVGRDRLTIRGVRDSKTARAELDQAYRERTAQRSLPR
jgi:hypothetical protein